MAASQLILRLAGFRLQTKNMMDIILKKTRLQIWSEKSNTSVDRYLKTEKC